MSADIEQILKSVFSTMTGLPPGPLICRPVGGGSINHTYQVLTKLNKRWFCKFNDARQFPDLFVKESRGLALIGQQQLIRVPETIACTRVDNTQVLILEWIDQAPPTPEFWRRFGKSLAQLHRLPQSQIPYFGLSEDNYMGALPQKNTPSPSWIDFFIQNRLEPQIHLATRNGLLDAAAYRHFQRLYTFLPEIFPPEPPSLLHGDLWSGNFLCDTTGNPVLIDPAAYFGHRSVDLAMTTLFGGFDPIFYEAYAHYYPLPANYREQWEISNLYPLLIHLNLFGKTYTRNILHTIQRF
jgi:fructosamine-3-kinase